MAKKDKYTWVIALIDKDHLKICGWELESSNKFSNVEAFIPQARILEKKQKGKKVFRNVPLLFNYGFFKVPTKKLKNYKYLNELKDHVTCITGYLKNKANAKTKYLKKGIDESLPFAIALPEQIAHLRKVEKANQIYTAKELSDVKEGDVIRLKGYPFDGMLAKVLKIDFKREKVKVKILEELCNETLFSTMELEFENVFFSIYMADTEDKLMGHKSIDEIGSYNRSHNVFKDYDNE